MARSPSRIPLPLPRAAWLPWMQLATAMTETWLAAGTVVAMRLPALAMPARNAAELQRMVAEKPPAFGRAWQAAWWAAMAAPVHLQIAAMAPLRRTARANARRLGGSRR